LAEIQAAHQVGVTPITFHKIGIADIHKVEGDNTGVAHINASNQVKIKTPQVLLQNNNIQFYGSGGNDHVIYPPKANFPCPNLENEIRGMTAPGTDAGNLALTAGGAWNGSNRVSIGLNAFSQRDIRFYIGTYRYTQEKMRVEDNGVIFQFPPENGNTKTIWQRSTVPVGSDDADVYIPAEPAHTSNICKIDSLGLHIDTTSNIYSNDETGKHFFKSYIAPQFPGTNGHLQNYIFGNLGVKLNKKYTYSLAIYVYSDINPVFGTNVPKGVMELRLSGYLGTNVDPTTNASVTVSTDIIWSDGFGGNPTSTYSSPNVKVILQDSNGDPLTEENQYFTLDLYTYSGEYYIPIFKRLY